MQLAATSCDSIKTPRTPQNMLFVFSVLKQNFVQHHTTVSRAGLEVLPLTTPPAHWLAFLRGLKSGSFPMSGSTEADRYEHPWVPLAHYLCSYLSCSCGLTAAQRKRCLVYFLFGK